MRRLITLASIVTLANLFLAGQVFAGNQPAKSPPQKPEARSGGHPATMPARQGYEPELWRISKLHDMKVLTEQGKELGTVRNTVIDTDRGCVAYAVIAHGGILGIGAKDVLLPFATISSKSGAKYLQTTATTEQFKQAEGFDADHPDQVRKLSDPAFAERFSREFGVRPYWEHMGHSAWMKHEKTSPGEKSSGESPQASARETTQGKGWPSQAGTTEERAGRSVVQRGPGETVLTSTLLSMGGVKIKTQDGAVNVGDLNDLMVDLHGDHIAYAVAERERELVHENRLCAVPWSFIRLQRAEPRPNLVVALSAGKIKDAPGFQDAHWPDMAKMNWEDQINGYYGSRPYYAIYGYVRTPEPWSPESFSRNPVETIEGTIVSINQSARGPGLAQPGVQVNLRVVKNETQAGQIKEGQTVLANLAPSQFLKDKGIELKEGGTLTITGFVTRWEHGQQSHMAIVARDVRTGEKTLSLRNQKGEPEWSEAMPGSPK